MLGLLKRSPSGAEASLRSAAGGSQTSLHQEESSTQVDSSVIARAAAANAAAMRRNSSTFQSTMSPPMSPSTSKAMFPNDKGGSLRSRKGMSMNMNMSNMNMRRSVNGFRGSSSQMETVGIVKDNYLSIRHRCHRELGSGVGLHFLDVSYVDLMDWIRDERLTRLPHKGGSWDRVLVAAQHFADHVYRLSQAIESFAPESDSASNLVFGQCLLLLDKLGHENAAALDKAFTLFNQVGLEIAPLLRREDILMASPEIMENVSTAFSDMLTIVADVAMGFYGALHHTRQGQQDWAKVDIHAKFGHHMDNFRARVRQCSFEIWRYVLERAMEDPAQVLMVQAWLAPQDTVLAMLSSDHVNLVSRPEEQTCTWIQPHLNSFFKGDEQCLLVQGKPGSGKTVLANWVVDRLQRPVSRRNISTLSFFYNSNVMAWSTPLAMLKTLLLQLMTQRIGDLKLFNTVMRAYMDSRTLVSTKDQEDRMWDALESALEITSDDAHGEMLAIVVDGLDEMDGQKSEGRNISEKLQRLAHKSPSVRLIMFSQPMEPKQMPSATMVSMSIENTADDFQTVIRKGLNKATHFSERSEAAQEHIVEQIMSVSDGSMLYAFMAIRFLKLQKSHPTFDRGLDLLVNKSQHTTTDIVQQLLAVMQPDKDSKLLLSWLVAAQRPLTRKETEMLFQAQAQQGKTQDSRMHLDSIIKNVAPFVMTGEGLIALRHRAVKEALISLPESSPLAIQLKDRHRDILIRLFQCSRPYLHSRDDSQPMMAFMDQDKVETRLASDRLLEYTIRYWPVHFRESPSLSKHSGDVELPQELMNVFPDSVDSVLLEAGCWQLQALPHKTMELLTVAYRVRRAAYGEKHPAVLQAAIICAMFCENVLIRTNDAVEWYVKAINIGRNVLGIQSDLVINCCTTVLHLTESHTSKTRTEITTYREETLFLLITAYKQRYGDNSEEVLEIYNQLIQLYNSIGEEKKATEITTKITEITTTRDSEHHHHESGPAHGTRKLSVMIKHQHRAEVENYEDLLFGYKEEERNETLTIARVEEMMISAMKMIANKEFSRAEEMFLELWLKLDENSRLSQSSEWHEKKIQVILKYVELLHSRKRSEEASAMLLSCWNEYSNHAVSSFESIIVHLKEVGVWMQRMGMSSTALNVFQKCFNWFKSTHKENTAMFEAIQEHIAVTSKDIVKTSSTANRATISESSESVIREVFESSLALSESTEEITSTTVELCESLSSIYMKEDRWSQAASVLKSTLMRSSFSSFFSDSFEGIDLKSSLAAENTNLVTKLAECYIQQRRYEKAEHLYLRLYRLHRKNYALDDAHVLKYTEMYISFLKKHDMFNQLISFYQELLVEYRKSCGSTHNRTISILYALGDICRSHPVTHGYFVDYYAEIVNNLNKGALICHENAFQALIVVADHYYESQRYSESLVYFKSIIATFCKFGTKYKSFEDATMVQSIVEKYCRAIEEAKVEVTEHLAILKEIRQACIQYYGEDSAISINTTLTLAEVCQKSEAHEYEAVSYYEHVMKHSKTVSKSVVERSQSTLKSLYVKQATSSSSKTVTKETLEKATEMSYNRYVEIRKAHSITHQITLAQLKELVTLYHKQSKTEAAVTEMRNLTVDCMARVTSSKELIETAKSVASIYSSCGYVSQAQTLIRELKLQLIYKKASKNCGFDITSRDLHVCFPYIAAFEWSLRTDLSMTLATFMANLLAESMFYERFITSINGREQMHIVLIHAARLRDMLFRLRRKNEFEIVELQMINYFISVEPSVAKSCSKSSIRSFLNVLLTHFSSRHEQFDQDLMTSLAGHAAVRELRALMRQNQFREAVDLARCSYLFLMAHEGLDDPTEISLGFQLCLLMAGRGLQPDSNQANGSKQMGASRQMPSDPALQKEMMELSRTILGEVLEICKSNDISLVRCKWSEVNDLISLLGEVKDLHRLQWLLTTLWESRDGQSTWGQDVMLELGTRLVQASFMASGEKDSDRKQAIRLAEDLCYNVRRVHGARHQSTISIMNLLASLYTSTAQRYQAMASAENNHVSATDKKRAGDMAKIYFKKACIIHEDVLKLIVDSGDGDDGSDDESVVSSISASRRGLGLGLEADGRHGSRASSPGMQRKGSMTMTSLASMHHHEKPTISREEEVLAAKTHLRHLKLALQRCGSWARPMGEYERLTTKVWSNFGPELKASGWKEEQAMSKKWNVDGFGGGKAEGGMNEGAFEEPVSWGINY